MTFDRFGCVSDGGNAAMSCPEIPFLQGSLEAFPGLFFVDILEVLPDMIGPHGFQVESGHGLYGAQRFALSLWPRKRSCSFTSAFRTSSTAVLMTFMMWYLSKVMAAFGRFSSTPLMKAGDISMETMVRLSPRSTKRET